MPTISFTISAANLVKIQNAMKGLYEIPVGTDNLPIFTDPQWAKERTRRWVRDQVARYAQSSSRNTISFLPDDSVIS